MQRFGQLLSQKQIFQQRKGVREEGKVERWGGGGKKAEIDRLLKGLLQPVRSFN